MDKESIVSAESNMVKPGDIIRFIYNNGSNPGSIRTVEVSEIDGLHIKGVDLDINEPRCFLTYHIAPAVELIGNKNEDRAIPMRQVSVHFTNAAKEVVEATKMADSLALMYGALIGRETVFNSKTGCLEYEVPQQTFVVNGEVLTLDELRQLVEKYST